MYNLNYNDIDLSGLIKILNVKKSILPSRTNYTIDIPNVNGEYYLGFKYGAREIEIDFAVICNTAEEYDSLIRILADGFNVTSPQKLYLGEENDRYYYAVPDVSSNLEQILSVGKGTLKFICYDPVAYSDNTKIFTGDYVSGITTVNNGGSLDTPPVISVGFTQTAHFLQVTNYDGKTILLGQRPSVDLPSEPISPILLDDDCSNTSGWVVTGNILDGLVNGEVMGTVGINKYGTGITGADYGTSTGSWHGASVKKTLSTTAKEFEVIVDIAFDSVDTGVGGSGNTGSGSGGGSTAPTSGTFKIVAEPCLRIREGRSISNRQVGYIPNNTIVNVTDISGGWGKVSYGGATGYICMDYTISYTETVGNYKVTDKMGLNIRKGKGTNYGIVATMPYGTTVQVTDISGGWGKVVNYNGKSGYSSMNYLTPVSKASTKAIDTKSGNYLDYQKMGRVEFYLFDKSGIQLGKFVVADNSEYYETVQPEIYIGSNCVLTDATNIPTPNAVNNNGTITNVDSGKYGDWTDSTIRFTLSRLYIDGQMQWRGKIEKVKNGTVVKAISTNVLVNSKYPTGNLDSVSMWFSQYKDVPLIDTMSVEHVKVISTSAPLDVPVNMPIFENGDEVKIDCGEHKVYRNGIPFLEKLDIGSQFFTSGSGDSQFIVVSDDRNINVITGIKERYL